MQNRIDVLAIIKPQDVQRYAERLAHYADFSVQLTSDAQGARRLLMEQNVHVDVLIVDNRLENMHQLITELRSGYPRMLIILVDEEADFGIPGQADDLSTDPFNSDDLANRIYNLISERRQETVRSDSLPAVRAFAQRLRSAAGLKGKHEVAVELCRENGYDYVAYYDIEQPEAMQMTLRTQAGPAPIRSVAPKETSADDLMTWVAKNRQSRIAGPEDRPNHPLVARGRLGAIACVPVAQNEQVFGVLVACQDRPNSITQENILILELIGAQLAFAIAKETPA